MESQLEKAFTLGAMSCCKNSHNHSEYTREMTLAEHELGWQPIGTAPKNKRIILGFFRQIAKGISTLTGKWNEEKQDFDYEFNAHIDADNKPISWHELPEQ